MVPDNALTATHRKIRGEPARFVTDRHRQMADHYGTAIVTGSANPRQGRVGIGGEHGQSG